MSARAKSQWVGGERSREEQRNPMTQRQQAQ
jgi:hypothetical protein